MHMHDLCWRLQVAHQAEQIDQLYQQVRFRSRQTARAWLCMALRASPGRHMLMASAGAVIWQCGNAGGAGDVVYRQGERAAEEGDQAGKLRAVLPPLVLHHCLAGPPLLGLVLKLGCSLPLQLQLPQVCPAIVGHYIQ